MKKVDLSEYTTGVDLKPIIRKTFFNDYELMILFCVLNNEQPTSLPELTRHYNRLFQKGYTKQWTDSKIKKLENFNIYEKKAIKDCNSHSKQDKKIIENHKKWFMEKNIPTALYDSYQKTSYYYLTEEGEEWIEFIGEQLKRRKQENV